MWNPRVADILAIQNAAAGAHSTTVLTTAQSQLSRLNSISHMSSPLALCYRDSTLSLMPGHGIECRQKRAKKSSFFRTLQELSDSQLAASNNSQIVFLKENISHPGGYDSFHVDVENVAHHGLQKSARSRTVGEVMREQMGGQLRPLLLGERAKSLRHVYLHCDVSKWTVLQKGGTQATRDDVTGSGVAGIEARGFHEDIDSATFSRREKERYTTGYLFYGAKAAIQLNAEFNEKSSVPREIKIYLFGGGFAIHKNVFRTDLTLVDVWRCPTGSDAKAVLYLKDRGYPEMVAGSLSSEFVLYDQNTCIQVSAGDGISICPEGENRHGEAETRIIFAHETITKPLREKEARRLDIDMGLEYDIPKALVVSNDSDCPAISACCAHQVRGQGFVHKVSNQFIYIDEFLNLLDFLDLSTDSLIVANALGGNDFCPGTEGVPQTCYLQALVKNRGHAGGWKYLGTCGETDDERYFADTEAVMLTTLAFMELRCYVSQIATYVTEPCFISSMRHRTRQEFTALLEKWIVNVRKAVFKSSGVDTAAKCLPDTESIVLQGRRAAFVVKYWKGAFTKCPFPVL